MFHNHPIFVPTNFGSYQSIFGSKTETPVTKGTIGYDYRMGNPVPNWKTLIRNLQSATGGYERRWVNIKSPGEISCDQHNVDFPSWGWSTGCNGFWTNNLDVDFQDETARDIALAKLKAKIAKEEGDFAVLTNVPQDLYELRRTIRGTLDSVDGLMNGLANLVKGRGVLSHRIVENAANLWLNWSFGINPTLNDANDLIDSIGKFLRRKNHIRHFRASMSSDKKTSGVYHLSPCAGLSLDLHEEIYYRVKYRYIAAINFHINSANNYDDKSFFHLSPTDIVPMLWELLPWSWLIDYFTTAGAFLEDVFQSDGTVPIYCLLDRKVEISNLSTVSNISRSSGWKADRTLQQPRLLSRGGFYRTAHTSIPGRILRFKTSDEIAKNGLNKVANLASILMTRNTSGRGR